MAKIKAFCQKRWKLSRKLKVTRLSTRRLMEGGLLPKSIEEGLPAAPLA